MNALRAFGAALVATFRDGTRLVWIAPLIALIAGLPEFAQHMAEIKLGMFAGPAAFKALQNDPTRWAFGYVKVAGLFLAMFAAARYWTLPEGSRGRWWDLRNVAWRPFLIGLVLNAGLSGVLFSLKGMTSDTAFQAANTALSIATLPVTVYMLGGLFGDRAVTLRQCYRTGWWQAAAMAALFLIAMLPAQIVHKFDHTLAMGAPAPAVWALMLWDALLVSLIACWAGTGLAAGYAIGRTPPAPEPALAPAPTPALEALPA